MLKSLDWSEKEGVELLDIPPLAVLCASMKLILKIINAIQSII
ncbi:Uncharacterised protein [Avibacterium paragallinarum]|uniref:Uncharacterized protein n=1 Tax=Avibacterium paragallinarum TaxID=728 RepID=A0A380Z191_AVIPA|nr:Uncharacterised protein [Avibacterium paragallinarum]